jgi:flagellar biosynthesis component FlhA
MYRMLQRKIDDIPVLSYAEVSDDVPLRVLGTVSFKSNQNQGDLAA